MLSKYPWFECGKCVVNSNHSYLPKAVNKAKRRKCQHFMALVYGSAVGLCRHGHIAAGVVTPDIRRFIPL